ncbi:MAG: HTH domain-containing protein [Candidatus Marinimicrobia bacterium]|nr:HTH domain-containing protein [Candidatus Neomarinimicrobiota bacterium]
MSFSFSDAFWITFKSNITEGVTKNVTENVTENRDQSILKLIRTNKHISTTELSQTLNVSRRTIARDIEKLKKNREIIRIGPDKGGYWEVIE